MKRLFLGSVAAFVVVTSYGHAETVILFDGDFLEADYDVSLLGTTHIGGGSASTFPVGGNPGSFRNVQHQARGGGFGSTSTVWNINTALTYDPSTRGAIEQLNYSEDNLSLSDHAYLGAVALRQDGFLYRSVETFVTTVSNSVWTQQEVVGLTAEDFELHFVDPSTGQFLVLPTGHPDFSDAGSTIEFGFWRQDGGNGFTRNGGLDNLRFELQVSVVPEPSTALMTVVALFGGCFSGRRIHKHPSL